MTEYIPLNIAPLPLKLRIEDFTLLDGSGAFAAYAKVELIEGEILFMNAQHRPHAYRKSELAYLIRRALEQTDSALYVITEGSVSLPPDSMPEPDIALTSDPRGDGPIPVGSVALIIEVADATLANDLDTKSRLYARHGIPEYWVIDVNGRAVHQMWRPEAERYAERRSVAFGDRMRAATIDALEIDTGTL